VSIADLQAEWLELLKADLARRVTRAEWEATQDERAAHQLLEQMAVMSRRMLRVAPSENEKLADELSRAKSWSEINVIRERADLSPAASLALVYVRDPERAVELLSQFSQRRNGGSG
jgi:hypothetical protein